MIKLKTANFYLREFISSDVDSLFELDSSVEVNEFLGNKPTLRVAESAKIILFIQAQYNKYGVGRWAVFRRENDEFIGWAGIKFFTEKINDHQNFYELGYRFLPKYWGKGYASEIACALVSYTFDELNQKSIFAYTHPLNFASQKVLINAGFAYKGVFLHENEENLWFEIHNL